MPGCHLTAIFRADATQFLGSGHVMRCLALAQALTDRGIPCLFAVNPEAPETVPALRSSGHEIRFVDGPLADQARQLAAIVPEVSQRGRLLLVVDHYQWRAEIEWLCRAWANRILVIDDLADRPHDCDIVVDSALGRSPSDYVQLVPPGAQMLLGPAYAPLRPEFAALRAKALARRGAGGLGRILVTMGLTDPGNATAVALDGLVDAGIMSGI
ncbi:MAG: UDP-2,4-diacetamido-2,4,6-trideoxy-beta-L-altropyranose hydrolase, partial [Alphaproteobacteria bacterium]